MNQYSPEYTKRVNKYIAQTCFHKTQEKFDCNKPVNGKYMLLCNKHYKEWYKTVDEEDRLYDIRDVDCDRLYLGHAAFMLKPYAQEFEQKINQLFGNLWDDVDELIEKYNVDETNAQMILRDYSFHFDLGY